jgi:uncharacterized SAM-binding protein YcdF (DUF218 family)
MTQFVHLTEPATFVAVLLLIGTLYTFRAVARGYRRRLCWLWAGVLAIYMAFATPLGGNALLRPLETAAREAATRCRAEGRTPGTAVVLAGGIDVGATTAADYQFLSESSLRRTFAAARWAQADSSRHLLLSGGYGEVPEALLMARLLADLGVAATRISLDSESTNTSQSGHNIAEQLRRVQVDRVLVITSADHMPRALAELHSRGILTCALPVDYRYVAPILPGHLVPQLTALSKSTRALHEYFSLLLQLLSADG